MGNQGDEKGDVASKTEIPPNGPALGDLDSDTIEDYLVDTSTGKIVATLPDFEYYEGSEGRENHFNLAVGWSPDDHGGIAIYQARYATGPIAWINPLDHKALNVYPQIEKAITRASIQKFGRKAADYEISVMSPVFVRPRRIVFNVMVGELSSKRENAVNHSCDVVFDVRGNLDAPQFELATVKWLRQDSESESQNEDEETQLNRVYHKLAASLPPREREALKQQQLKWLETRGHIMRLKRRTGIPATGIYPAPNHGVGNARQFSLGSSLLNCATAEFLLNIRRSVFR